jgi:steroid delta-isomerase-like uncharacterized protein
MPNGAQGRWERAVARSAAAPCPLYVLFKENPLNARLLAILLPWILLLNGCAQSVEDQVTRNIEVIRVQHTQVWSQGRVDLIEDLYAEDFIGHFPAGIVRGRQGIKERVEAHRRAFPDWTEEIDDTIAQGDRVVTRFTSRGTNEGAFLGKPPTGRQVEISEVAIYRLSEGQIVEQWVYPDMGSMQQQLSVADGG